MKLTTKLIESTIVTNEQALELLQAVHEDCTVTFNGATDHLHPDIKTMRSNCFKRNVPEIPIFLFMEDHQWYNVTAITRQGLGPGIPINYDFTIQLQPE